MSSTRDFKSPGIFAENATTVIPPTPIQGVAYRDQVNGTDDTPNGWRYGTKVESQDWNQIMFLITSMLSSIDSQGVLGWSSAVDYSPPAVAFGSNGLLYIALQNSGPSTAAQDPISSPLYWEQFASHGRIVLESTGASVWTVPAAMRLGIIKPLVKVIAGGGGGARNTGTPSPSGGGGGGVAEGYIDLTGVTSVNVSVGAGGAGATVNGLNGGNGSNSAFGAYLTATGGSGGPASGASAGFGGVGSGGSLNYSIGSGSVPYSTSNGGFGGGGESPAGSSGSTPPIGKGQGGAGRISTAAPNGANGAIIIEW